MKGVCALWWSMRCERSMGNGATSSWLSISIFSIDNWIFNEAIDYVFSLHEKIFFI